MSKYAKLFPLLQRLEETKTRTWNYDPHNYEQAQLDLDKKEIELELDAVFRGIIASL